MVVWVVHVELPLPANQSTHPGTELLDETRVLAKKEACVCVCACVCMQCLCVLQVRGDPLCVHQPASVGQQRPERVEAPAE